MKRAADLAEALYSMPSRGNLPQSRSPPMSNTAAMPNYNGYASQLSVSEHDPSNTTATQWKDGRLCRRLLNDTFVDFCEASIIKMSSKITAVLQAQGTWAVPKPAY